ncbi:MAG TPA: biphenyl 2,3-dioxygenase, partial [Alphaproteobacteria bacterium]|nr:biphenyl 2,3-dioxygenase [Alphaproteobacteria bacterium]
MEYRWPEQGLQAVPDWIYTSPDILARELDLIFRGRTWNYVGLEAELPKPGDFKRSYIGDATVVVSRAEDGSIH